MKILAFVDPDQVSEELLRDSAGNISYLSKPIFRQKIFKGPRRFSLITRNPEKKTVRIHRLVRDASFRSLEANRNCPGPTLSGVSRSNYHRVTT